MLSDIGDPFAVGLPGGLPASLGGVTCLAAKGRPGLRGGSGLPDCGGGPYLPRLSLQASETSEELGCPGNHARADARDPDPSSRAAQTGGTANRPYLTLTRKSVPCSHCCLPAWRT